jgi:DNA-binding NarL/FixJ family response regulator
VTNEYADQKKQWEKRRREIVRLHAKGKTLREIGESLDPPVSRQRVRAVLIQMGVENVGRRA